MTNKLYPVIILAGGLATRLRPMTTKLPKTLININGEPFIFHQLRLLKNQGITDVVLSLGYLGEQVRDLVGDGAKFNLNIKYVFDGPNLLGTAGAIRNCLPFVGDYFFILYGDSYLACDYASIQSYYQNLGLIGLMTVFKNNGHWDQSNIIFRDNKIKVYDKKNCLPEMKYIDYGLGILSQKAFLLDEVKVMSDLADVYQVLLNQNNLAGFEVNKRFYEIGSFAGIDELNKYLA